MPTCYQAMLCMPVPTCCWVRFRMIHVPKTCSCSRAPGGSRPSPGLRGNNRVACLYHLIWAPMASGLVPQKPLLPRQYPSAPRRARTSATSSPSTAIFLAPTSTESSHSMPDLKGKSVRFQEAPDITLFLDESETAGDRDLFPIAEEQGL